MKVMFRASAAVALVLATATAAVVRADSVVTVDVNYDIFDFYNPGELLRDGTIRVTARNDATGETFDDDRGSHLLSLPVGTYTFTGRSQWCYLAQATIEITVDTTDIALYAGCE